jgi:hypothetical protein
MKQLYFLFISILVLLLSTAKAQFRTLGTWKTDGTPNYLITPRDVLDSGFLRRVNTTLPEYRAVPIYQPRLLSDTVPEVLDIKCATDVWITFVHEGASYTNMLGFFTFTGNPPAVAPDSNQITLIFPNASLSGFGGGLLPGDKVFLGSFPVGTKIGFVLLANGWKNNRPTWGLGPVYSVSAYNTRIADSSQRRQTVMLRDDSTDRFVFGFEDILRPGGDKDFNDLLFFATLNPKKCAEDVRIPTLINGGTVVYSGNTGGIESHSLGDIIGKRNYKKAKENRGGEINYNATPKVRIPETQLNTTGAKLTLADMMPKQMLDPGYEVYNTSPFDLTGFTNAKEVLSFDFTLNQQAKAVAFATRTTKEVYNHTKPICDRLRGAQLLNAEVFTLEGLEFVRYTLLQEKGNLEYATSFSVGRRGGRNSFSFQSRWMTKDYEFDDEMYNFQLWAVAPHLVIDMALDILQKLRNEMPVETIGVKAKVPDAYIKAGQREGSKLLLTMQNLTLITTGYFELDEKINEQATITTRKIPFNINGLGKSILEIPIQDAYEADIRMYLNGELEDMVYTSDGNWDLDYNRAQTTIKQFKVTNQPSRTYKDEYPLFRDILIEGTTSSYVTAYKFLRGGGAAVNLSAYKALRFNASGGNKVTITLIKEGIRDWKDQYQISFNLSKENKEYLLALSDFTSTRFTQPIDLSDVTSVVFSFEVSTNTTIQQEIKQAGFVKTDVAYLRSLEAKQVTVFPNPAIDRIQVVFKSPIAENITLRLVEPATGRIITQMAQNAVEGENRLSMNLPIASGLNQMILHVQTASGRTYQPVKVVRKQ